MHDIATRINDQMDERLDELTRETEVRRLAPGLPTMATPAAVVTAAAGGFAAGYFAAED